MGDLTTQGMERSRRRVRLANGLVCWVLPLALLGAGADLVRWQSRVSAPVEPLPPSLEELDQPLPTVGAAGLSAELFEQRAPPVPAAAPKPAQQQAPVVAPEAKWKLRGVLMAGGKRAFLEEEGGRGVWVTEGEQVGSTRVKEIRERSVVLEGAEGQYEIRM